MLFIFALFSELIYLFLFFKAREAGSLNLHNDQHMVWVVGSLFVLFIVYFLAFRFVNWRKQSIKQIFLMAVVFQITFLFIPFLWSNDLYSYIFSSRIMSIFGENPYFITYDNFVRDPLFAQLKTIWAGHTVLYGPLFLHIGGFINFIGQNNLIFLTLAFKSLFIGANILNIFLVYKISKSREALFLFGASPLMVLELAGNSHTESILLLFLLLSFYLLYNKPVYSFVALIASVLVKYYSLIFLPFYLIHLAKKGVRKLIVALVLGGLLTIGAYLPFWDGFGIFDYLISYYNGQYISPSLGVYVGEKLLGSYSLSFGINTFIFLMIALALGLKFWFSKPKFKEFVFYSFLLYWAYLLTKSSLILSWYLIPLVALASLCARWEEYQKLALVGIVFASIYSLALYYFAR